VKEVLNQDPERTGQIYAFVAKVNRELGNFEEVINATNKAMSYLK